MEIRITINFAIKERDEMFDKAKMHSHTHEDHEVDPGLKKDFEQNQEDDFKGMECYSSHSGDEHGEVHGEEHDHEHDREQGEEHASSPEEIIGEVIEDSIMKAVIPDTMTRRTWFDRVGKGAAAALVASFFPLDAAKSIASETVKNIEKKDLSIGFIPITCATPIIMAEPMGFYEKHGLNATVRRAAGWAMVRDWAINKDVDAAHMLSPMPLSISLGAGSKKVPFFMPAVENINGQAITLHKKHAGVKEAKDMKGFRFCVPFRYSMHNYLLRYYLAEGGVHPDKDVQIRVVPPSGNGGQPQSRKRGRLPRARSFQPEGGL